MKLTKEQKQEIADQQSQNNLTYNFVSLTQRISLYMIFLTLFYINNTFNKSFIKKSTFLEIVKVKNYNI